MFSHGSLVILKSGSEIRYKEHLWNSRRVKSIGEALLMLQRIV